MTKARMIGIVIVAATGLLIATVLGHRAFAPTQAHFDVPRAYFPMKGIDVSAHNGDIDFDLVASDSVDFVFMKATEGESFRDPLFDKNYEGARAAGLKVGAYHFFRFDCEGWRQSYHLLRTLDNRHLDLPIAIDVEESGNPEVLQTDQVTRNLRSMVDYLRASGQRVVIYTNKNGYRRFVRGHFDDVGLWMCSFSGPPLNNPDQWRLWQHSHIGRINGIEGNVDLNTFSGTRDEFMKWLVQMQ